MKHVYRVYKICSENEIPENVGDVILAQNRDENCQCVWGWTATDCLTDINECAEGRTHISIGITSVGLQTARGVGGKLLALYL
jgi:hypothetical protein